MGWSDWFRFGSSNKESSSTKERDKGDKVVREILTTNDGSKENHSHTWIERDKKSGKVTGGGAEPPKLERKKK